MQLILQGGRLGDVSVGFSQQSNVAGFHRTDRYACFSEKLEKSLTGLEPIGFQRRLMDKWLMETVRCEPLKLILALPFLLRR
jgi:hypothetical protein